MRAFQFPSLVDEGTGLVLDMRVWLGKVIARATDDPDRSYPEIADLVLAGLEEWRFETAAIRQERVAQLAALQREADQWRLACAVARHKAGMTPEA